MINTTYINVIYAAIYEQQYLSVISRDLQAASKSSVFLFKYLTLTTTQL